MTAAQTDSCSPIIRNAADLALWRERLSGDRHGVAAIVDDHGRPRLLTEGENGKMYVTSTGGEEDDDEPWDPADVELWAYGPFTVIHPATSLPPWPTATVEQEYIAALDAIIRVGDLVKTGAITEEDADVLRAGLDAGPSLLIDNVKLRYALAADTPASATAVPSSESEWWTTSCRSGHLSHHHAVPGSEMPISCRCGLRLLTWFPAGLTGGDHG